MRARFVLIGLAFCGWVGGAVQTAYIPHIANVYGWETKLAVANAGHAAAVVTLTVFTGGAPAPPAVHTVPAGESRDIPLPDGTCGAASWDAENATMAVVYRHTAEQGVAEFIVTGRTDTELHYTLPGYLAGRIDWVGLALMNPGDGEASATLTAFHADGAILGRSTVIVAARERVAAMLADFFPGVDAGRVDRVRVVSDRPLCGCEISGSGLARLLFMPATGPGTGAARRCLPHVVTDFPGVWENYLVLDNPADERALPVLHLCAAGRSVVDEELSVPAQSTRVVDLAAYAGWGADSGWLSGCPPALKARLSYVATVSGGIAEYGLDLAEAAELTFQFPRSGGGDFDWHGLALYNPGDADNTVILKAFRDGQEVDRELVVVPAGARIAGMLHAGAGIERVLASGDAPLAGLQMSGAGLDRLLFTPAAGYAETWTFEERLQHLPGVTVEPLPPIGFYPHAYALNVTQPLDHDDPGGPTFTQRIFLSHLDPARPMVMYLSGYALIANALTELGSLLQANQVRIPHRYFDYAVPEVLDWTFLTIRQSAADHHRIVTLLRDLYRGPWVHTGKSKGGMTAIFHRRFYPDDVTATVAYVAPLMLALEDPRPIDMIRDELGDGACRARIRAYQRAMLLQRAAMISRLATYSQQSGLPFSMGYGTALEYAVLEFPFAFWQYGPSDCAAVPGPGATVAEMFACLDDAVGLWAYSDPYVAYYYPAFYQFLTETGYTAIYMDPVADLLQAVPDPTYAAFAPPDADLVYRPEAMQDIVAWLQTEGDRMIYIYGGWDPWTGCAVELTGAADALKVVQPGADHGVTILGLDDRDLVLSTLGAWLGMEISPSAGKLAGEVSAPVRRPLPAGGRPPGR